MLRFFVEWHKHNTVDAVITGKLQRFFQPLDLRGAAGSRCGRHRGIGQSVYGYAKM